PSVVSSGTKPPKPKSQTSKADKAQKAALQNPERLSPPQGPRRPRLSSFRCNCQTAKDQTIPARAGSSDPYRRRSRLRGDPPAKPSPRPNLSSPRSREAGTTDPPP